MSNDLKTDIEKDIVNDIEKDIVNDDVNDDVDDIVDDVIKDIVDDVIKDIVDDNVKVEENKIRKRLDDFLNKNKSETIKYYLTYTGLGFGVGIVTSVILTRYFYNNKF